MLVVDASVLVNALIEETDVGERARARLNADSDLHAPHLADLEVLSVLRRLHRSGEVTGEAVERAIIALESLPLARYPHLPLVRAAWAQRDRLSTYDAAYTALAAALDAPLVTADTRLHRAVGLPCRVELLV